MHFNSSHQSLFSQIVMHRILNNRAIIIIGALNLFQLYLERILKCVNCTQYSMLLSLAHVLLKNPPVTGMRLVFWESWPGLVFVCHREHCVCKDHICPRDESYNGGSHHSHHRTRLFVLVSFLFDSEPPPSLPLNNIFKFSWEKWKFFQRDF